MTVASSFLWLAQIHVPSVVVNRFFGLGCLLFVLVILGVEPKASSIVGKYSPTELHSQPALFIVFSDKVSLSCPGRPHTAVLLLSLLNSSNSKCTPLLMASPDLFSPAKVQFRWTLCCSKGSSDRIHTTIYWGWQVGLLQEALEAFAWAYLLPWS